MIRFITLIVIAVAMHGCSRDMSSLDNWKTQPIPRDKNTLLAYEHSSENWCVILKDGNIQAAKEGMVTNDTLPFTIDPNEIDRSAVHIKRIFIKVDDGDLVDFNLGEWGASLYWFSNNGQNKYKISDDEINQFVARGKDIFAIEKPAGSVHGGSILQLQKIDNKWAAVRYLELSTPPNRIAVDETGNFIVITLNSLLRISPQPGITHLIEDAFWQIYLIPNSMVIKDNVVYIGMRVGIFKYNLVTNKQEWLMPK